MDFVAGGIGACRRITYAVGHRANTQYPAAGGDHLAIMQTGAGVENPGAVQFRIIQTRNHVAFRVAVRDNRLPP